MNSSRRSRSLRPPSVTAIADIRAIETTNESVCLIEFQAGNNFVPGRFIGGGGQGHSRHTGETFLQAHQPDVFRAEIMSLLGGGSMRLIDGEQ